MNSPSPLPLSYWEALRQLAEQFQLMKFTLVYDDDLPVVAILQKLPMRR